MASRIAKRGVLFLSALLVGLYFIAFGFIYYLVTLAVFGLLCELVMWGRDAYARPLRNAIGYGLFYIAGNHFNCIEEEPNATELAKLVGAPLIVQAQQ